MRNRLGVTLALTAILALGGMTLAKTPRTANPQNTNTAGGTATSGMTHKRHKARHKRHHKRHRKAAAAANANR